MVTDKLRFSFYGSFSDFLSRRNFFSKFRAGLGTGKSTGDLEQNKSVQLPIRWSSRWSSRRPHRKGEISLTFSTPKPIFRKIF